ncbi:MAG: ShlB/FhaC/HecB family hemolysin secretion/activation protein, partial [Alphaproteobacteria bacterium]|nr:ShlB/FhaC/HecB family hemolysin secretion/activation protein [Alphaproteobacteria bacterium]
MAALSLAIPLAAATPTLAQAPPLQLPGAVEPGRPPDAVAPPQIDFQLELLIPDSRRDIPDEEAAAVKFDLAGLQITGVTVYPPARMKALYEKLIGTEVSLADLFKVANAIEALYRADDYVLSRAFIPAQRVTDGVFKIEVIEGYVSEIEIQGDVAGVQELIEATLKGLTAEKPLKARTLERRLLLVNDLPGVSAQGVLRPSQATVGAAQLVVNVGIDHYSGSFSANNRQSKFAGPVAFTVTGASHAFTGAGERTGFVHYMTSDWDEQRFNRVQHERSIGSNGMRATVGLEYGTSEPGGNIKGGASGTVRAKSFGFDAGVSFPFIRSRTENFTGQLDASLRNTKVKQILQQSGSNTFSQDRIRKIRMGFTYERADELQGVTRIGLDWHQGFKAFGWGKANPSRDDGEFDFTKLTADIVRLQRIAYGFSLLLAASGQSSSDPLLASEEFTVGGARFGRGYDPSEISGDDGVAFSAELQFRNDGDFGLGLVKDFELYSFYDFGSVWNKNRADQKGSTETIGIDSLVSWGGGIRTNIEYELGGEIMGFGLNVEYAKPLSRVP